MMVIQFVSNPAVSNCVRMQGPPGTMHMNCGETGAGGQFQVSLEGNG